LYFFFLQFSSFGVLALIFYNLNEKKKETKKNKISPNQTHGNGGDKSKLNQKKEEQQQTNITFIKKYYNNLNQF
jgi:hypothetical protein